MTLTIPDEMLRDSGLSEREVMIEIACRLFDAGVIYKPTATRLLGISRDEFDAELIARGLPVIRIDEEYWEQEKQSLAEWERRRREEGA